MAELKDEVLNEVTGGAGLAFEGPRIPINLTGVYWGTSYKESGPYNLAIGWKGLYAQRLADTRATAPYYITDSDNVAIGFTVGNNFSFR